MRIKILEKILELINKSWSHFFETSDKVKKKKKKKLVTRLIMKQGKKEYSNTYH